MGKFAGRPARKMHDGRCRHPAYGRKKQNFYAHFISIERRNGAYFLGLPLEPFLWRRAHYLLPRAMIILTTACLAEYREYRIGRF